MSSVKKLAVVGLGYVGLPLALLADRKGYDVIGLDVDEAKIAGLKEGRSHVDDILPKDLKASKVNFTTNPKAASKADAFIVCVPTPVNDNKEPNLEPVKSAIKSIAPQLRPGVLVIIESTINPGVCDEIVIPELESLTNLLVGKDIYLAHCPERINPGDKRWNVGNINRVIGANSGKELKIAKALYESLIDAEIKPMGSLKEAEAVKVVENSFRDINIAFVNELAMSFATLGINVNNVIDGAATKPFAFMAHYPGIGVGGHCIPVDPYYLIEYARTNGFEHKFLALARNINEAMPIYAVATVEKRLVELTGLTLEGSTIAVLGISYKAGVADDRESPAYTVISELKRRGASVVTYDPFFPKKSSAKSLDEALAQADASILVTAHPAFADELKAANLERLALFYDGRNALAAHKSIFAKADVDYIGLGT